MSDYRIQASDPQKQEQLRLFLQQYIPQDQQQAAMDSIDQTGAISPEVFKSINADSKSQAVINQKLNDIGLNLAPEQQALQQLLGKDQVDPTTLTDSELQSRIDELTAYGKTTGPGTTGLSQQIDNMSAQIKGAFLGAGVNVSDDTLKQISTYAINALKNGNYDPQGVANIIGAADPGSSHGSTGSIFGGYQPDSHAVEVAKSVGQGIPTIYTTQVQGGTFVDKPGTSPDVAAQLKALTDVQTARQQAVQSQTDLTNYNTGLQGELSKGTEQFIQQQTQAANQNFQQNTAPDIAQTLNQRGLLFGGDLPSSLLSEAASVQGGLEQQHANLLAEDLAFWQDAGYQQQLQTVINAGGNVTNALQTQQQNALDLQQQRFSGSEQALNLQAQSALQARQAQQQLATNQAATARNISQANQNTQNQLIQAGSTAAGQIAGVAAVKGISG